MSINIEIPSLNEMIFYGRKNPHDKYAKELKSFLKSNGFIVAETGIEKTFTQKELTEFYRNKDTTATSFSLRSDFYVFRNDPYFPHSYWDAKTQSKASENFSIHKEAWEENQKRKDIRIIYAGKHFHGQEYAQWMDKLEDYKKYHPGSSNGSGKPNFLIPLSAMIKLEDFINQKF